MMGGIAPRTGEYQIVETHTFDYEKKWIRTAPLRNILMDTEVKPNNRRAY
jgi:hypothetical protein